MRQISHTDMSRWASINGKLDNALLRPQEREAKGQKFFGNLWGSGAAQANLEFNFKYCPDLYLQTVMTLDWYISEDGIFKPFETCMLTSAATICSNSPVQAMWHTRGIVRQGGTKTQAEFAQQLALRIAELYDVKTGKIVPVDQIDFDDDSSHA